MNLTQTSSLTSSQTLSHTSARDDPNSFDAVLVDNNEKQFIDAALSLGYGCLVFVSDNIHYTKYKDDRITVKTGYLIKNPSEIVFARKNFDYLFAPAERRFFEHKVDFIINSEYSDMKDSFHYRRTSLNQVHAKLAKENSISIVFSFSSILGSNDKKRLQTLGRMFQNAGLVRKYGLRNSVFSLATQPFQIRSRSTLEALGRVLEDRK